MVAQYPTGQVLWGSRKCNLVLSLPGSMHGSPEPCEPHPPPDTSPDQLAEQRGPDHW